LKSTIVFKVKLIKLKKQLDFEKASSLRLAFSEYMHYMTNVRRFLHPDLGTQKLETQKSNPLEIGWEKVLFRNKSRKPQKRGFKDKKALCISDFVKNYNSLEKLSLLREDKVHMGFIEKNKMRFREGFCGLCRLLGHIYKQCWTYPEEDVSDTKCLLCEGRHSTSPCYFEPEQVPQIS
jgi:hypothetical protein